MARIVSLAAGTVLTLGPEAIIDVAAASGYRHVGLRLDPSAQPRGGWSVLHERAVAAGVTIFDVEVVRLGVTPAREIDALVDAACELGATWLLTVSQDEDVARTVAGLEGMVARCTAAGVPTRPALEFMAFTSVRTLADALPIARAAAVGLVIDALHVHRNATTTDQVARLMSEPGAPRCYLQVCDTNEWHMAPEELADEARHRRRVPGTGILPLAALLAALPPETAVSAEVQSDELFASLGAREFALQCRRATEALVAPASRTRSGY